MRLLFVTRKSPWPQASGVQRRLASQLEILRQIGDITLVAPLGERPYDCIESLEITYAPRGVREARTSWFTHPSLPYGARPADVSLRKALESQSYQTFDVVWIHRLELWGAIRHLLPTTRQLVIDADDFVVAIKQKLADRPGSRGYLRAPRSWFLKEELRRWNGLLTGGLQQAKVAFSNPNHLAGLDESNAFLVRNAVKPIGPFHSRRSEPQGRTLGFVGKLDYGPNAEALRRLGTSLGAHLQRSVPGTRIRIIGKISQQLRKEVEATSKVDLEFTGYVENLPRELARLDALIMPITSGSGTRVKAVDAMSVGLPIISTAFGVEGLGLEHGESVLIGERDQELAACWARLNEDVALAWRVAETANSLYRSEFSLEALERDIAALLT